MLIALVVRTWPILESNSLGALLAGRTWQPWQKLFGFYPFSAGTVWVTFLALLIAAPPSLREACPEPLRELLREVGTFVAPGGGAWVIVAEMGHAADFRKVNRY